MYSGTTHLHNLFKLFDVNNHLQFTHRLAHKHTFDIIYYQKKRGKRIENKHWL